MQQYKFRAMRSDFKTNKWVYGSLITTPEGTYILEEGDSVEYSEPDYHSVGMGCGLEDRGITDRYEAMEHGFNKAVEKCCEIFPPFIPVRPETVGMYVGRNDRDGNQIFSGDIILVKEKDKQGISIVRWHESACKFEGTYISPEGRWMDDGTDCVANSFSLYTVIGNIHDNPELLTPTTPQS